MIMDRLGLQTETRFRDGSRRRQFLPWEEIEEVYLREAPFRFTYIFYLAVRIAEPADPDRSLVVLFPVHHRQMTRLLMPLGDVAATGRPETRLG